MPAAWKAVANGPELDRRQAGVRTTVRFAPTSPLPTYLFAFAAGNFSVESAERRGRTFRMFHRETDAAKVARNRDAIFDLHASALAWLEEYTGIPYPWGKFDFILIPSFQFGGMEHAGAILYNASSQLLEESATQNQFLGRASLIAHETTHMWFGDLVTMRWWDDLWLNEAFASWASNWAGVQCTEFTDEWATFLAGSKMDGYRQDMSPATHPIRGDVPDVAQAMANFDAITYTKGASVLKQLMAFVGEDRFVEALRTYFREHAWGMVLLADRGAAGDNKGVALRIDNRRFHGFTPVGDQRGRVRLAAVASHQGLEHHRIAVHDAEAFRP